MSGLGCWEDMMGTRSRTGASSCHFLPTEEVHRDGRSA